MEFQFSAKFSHERILDLENKASVSTISFTDTTTNLPSDFNTVIRIWNDTATN